MSAVVYDAGVLIAADRNDREVWADHRTRLEGGVIPVVPSVVVAQVSRSPRQVQLRRMLRGCDVVVLDEAGAHVAGEILASARTSDIVDAVVVREASSRAAAIVTGDSDDIRHLVDSTASRLRIVAI